MNKITPERMVEIYNGLSKEIQDKHFTYGVSGVNQPTKNRFFSKLINAVGEQEAIRLIKSEPAKAEPSGKTGELPTAETANQFKEASSISKMPMRSPKRKKAVADFDAKYGEGSYKRVSKIDANFGDIINKLENSNIVTKEC